MVLELFSLNEELCNEKLIEFVPDPFKFSWNFSTFLMRSLLLWLWFIPNVECSVHEEAFRSPLAFESGVGCFESRGNWNFELFVNELSVIFWRYLSILEFLFELFVSTVFCISLNLLHCLLSTIYSSTVLDISTRQFKGVIISWETRFWCSYNMLTSAFRFENCLILLTSRNWSTRHS